MSDNMQKTGEPDRSRIAMKEEHEVRYWTEALNVSREELQRIVDRVGNSVSAVRQELKK